MLVIFCADIVRIPREVSPPVRPELLPAHRRDRLSQVMSVYGWRIQGGAPKSPRKQ